jgi:hypothetical protein
VTEAPALIGGLTWEALSRERRAMRLKRGKHFVGDARAVERLAAEAARDLDCAVRTVRDDFRKVAYVWVQFADCYVPLGDPCPRCDGTDLLRTHEQFGRCTQCGARLIFTPSVRAAPAAAGLSVSKGDRKLQRLRQWRLEAFSDVVLERDREQSGPERDVLYGRGRTSEQEPVVLQVVYPLEDGARLPDPELEGEELYYLSYYRLEPYTRAAGLGVLDA